MGIAENAGYGMNKLASWEVLTGTRPTIESDRTVATVSFPLKSAIQRKTKDDNVGNNVGNNVGKPLTVRQQRILDLINDNPVISMAEMAKIIGVATRTIEREIPKIKNIVRHVGPKNGGYWELIRPK